MSEEKEEEPLTTGEMGRPFDERERSTSIDVTDKQMDWIFHYTLSKKIPYNDVVNSSDIQFIKDSQNYLEGFDIQVNDVVFAEAELSSIKK
jgi:hypothetical protein